MDFLIKFTSTLVESKLFSTFVEQEVIKMKAIRVLSFVIFCSCLLFSCQINRHRNGLKTGKWIYKDTMMGITSQSNGRYKKDLEVGTWKDYVGERLISTRKYKDSTCYITEFHNNGQIRAFGFSKMIVDSTKTDWVLTGEWKFYDSEGVHLSTKMYEKGIPVQDAYFNID